MNIFESLQFCLNRTQMSLRSGLGDTFGDDVRDGAGGDGHGGNG